MKLIKPVLLGLLIVQNANAASTMENLFLIKKDKSNIKRVRLVKNDPSTIWWVESSKQLLININKKSIPADLDASSIKRAQGLRLIYSIGKTKEEIRREGDSILIYGGRAALIATNRKIFHTDPHHKETPFQPNIVLDFKDERTKVDLTPSQVIHDQLKKLDYKYFYKTLESLAKMNRYTTNQSVPGPTEKFIISEFQKIPNLKISTQRFKFSNTNAFNIIGRLEPSQPTEAIYIVGAHFDSISEKPFESAPGAEDNASGTAGLLTIARNLAPLERNANILFVSFGAEEQGLHGSYAFVAELKKQNQLKHVEKVITMDMIGYRKGKTNQLLIETSSDYSPLVNNLASLAKVYADIETYHTFNYWGSDHVPFIKANLPTVLLIENFYGSYPAYHKSTDVPKNINQKQATAILKVATSALATWTLPKAAGITHGGKASLPK